MNKLVREIRSGWLLWKALGCLTRRRKDPETAIKWLVALRQENPEDRQEPWAAILLSSAYQAAGRLNEAKAVLGEGLRAHPDHHHLNRAMVEVMVESGSPVEEIIPYLKIVLRTRATGRWIPQWLRRVTRLADSDRANTKWLAWAEKTLLDYEIRNQNERF